MKKRGLKQSTCCLLLCAVGAGIVAVPTKALAGPGGKALLSQCSSNRSCTFDGIQNIALGNATLSINAVGHLVVSNIGSSGQDGFSQVSLPQGTGEVVTLYACPNFAQSQAGAQEVATFHANVPGGIFYRNTIENIGNKTLEIRPDFSPVGATLYTLTILNGGSVTKVFNNLPSATFQTEQGDQEEINWNSDGTASYKPTGPVTVVVAAVAVATVQNSASSGDVGDFVLVHAQDAKIVQSPFLTSVDYQFKNLGPIEITSEVAVVAPELIPALTPWGLIALGLLLSASGVVFLRRHQAQRRQ